jgi:hypothetical protein
MAIVLGTYINSSIKHARRNAAHERERILEDVMAQRKALGMDRDVMEDRMRRKEARAKEHGDADAGT